MQTKAKSPPDLPAAAADSVNTSRSCGQADRVSLETHYYEQFDADLAREVPAEALGGWKQARLPLSLRHSALVVMHAWDTGGPEAYPGWYQAVEFLPRANHIIRTVLPVLLDQVRSAGMQVIHVVFPGDYYKELPGYARTRDLVPNPSPPPAKIEPDPVFAELMDFRNTKAVMGAHNFPDIQRGFANLDIPKEVRPLEGEAVADTSEQLSAYCAQEGINHLIYTGFALNWCLLLSPGGMADMKRHDILCSTIREAVTAMENKESARLEQAKALALWRVSLSYGFVYDLDDFSRAIRSGNSS